jgi:ribosomal protein S13
MRVYGLAKELNVTNRKIAEIASELGIKVESPMKMLNDDQVRKIRDKFMNNTTDMPDSTFSQTNENNLNNITKNERE